MAISKSMHHKTFKTEASAERFEQRLPATSEPESVQDPSTGLYAVNAMVSDKLAKRAGMTEGEYKPTKKRTTKKATTKKATSTKKETTVKKETKTTKKVDKFGNGIGTSAHAINVKLTKKAKTAPQIAELVGCSTGRVASHLSTLMGKGFIKRTENGYVVC